MIIHSDNNNRRGYKLFLRYLFFLSLIMIFFILKSSESAARSLLVTLHFVFALMRGTKEGTRLQSCLFLIYATAYSLAPRRARQIEMACPIVFLAVLLAQATFMKLAPQRIVVLHFDDFDLMTSW